MGKQIQFLTAQETIERFGGNGFYFDISEEWYRIALGLDHPQVDMQRRVGGRPTEKTRTLVWLAHQLINWLPGSSSRLLWVSHWENHFLDFGDVMLATRRGLGEARSPSETPGHYFEALPFDELDCLALSSEQTAEINQLCGLISLMMLAGWDGWLISGDGIDRVEFFEGNIFFHSADPKRLKAAERLMKDANCSRTLI